ncbi:hypothetical protein B0H14DRAFT_3000548, partial [Mycena olivaceomarginata]
EGKEREEKEKEEEQIQCVPPTGEYGAPLPLPDDLRPRPSTLVRDARMPARRGALRRALASPGRGRGQRAGGTARRSSRPGDLLAHFAPRAAFLMGSGGAPCDVRSAEILELRRPCVQRRAREEVVHAVLCAPALARALYPGGGEHATHRPRCHTPRAPKEIKPGAEVGV